jgi:hypothetical protein
MNSKFSVEDVNLDIEDEDDDCGGSLMPRVLRFDQLSLASYVDETSVELQSYLKEWEAKVGSTLMNELERIISFRSQWLPDGCGVGLPGSELQEMLHHAEWALTKCASFFGRTELLLQAAALVHTPRQAWSEWDFFHARGNQATNGVREQLGAVSLLVTGESGSGKSAFMAKLADMLYLLEFEHSESKEGLCVGQRRPVITRFCGTSAASSTGLSLVQSLCRQIEFVFADPMLGLSSRVVSEEEYQSVIDCLYKSEEETDAALPTSCPEDYTGAVKYLHHLLRQHAVILIIDSLDQLSDHDRERSALSFLAGVHTHLDTRIIVSSLPDQYDQTAPEPLAHW